MENNFITYCMEQFSEMLTWGGKEIKENNYIFEVKDNGETLILTDLQDLKQIKAHTIMEMERKLTLEYGA